MEIRRPSAQSLKFIPIGAAALLGLRDPGAVVVMTASVRGELIGYVAALVAVPCNDRLIHYIIDLCVVSEVRHLGIGTLLMRQMIRRQHFDGMIHIVHRPSPAMKGLLKSVGIGATLVPFDEWVPRAKGDFRLRW
jgi:GNAT superfamily N-acetyltransferase